MSSLWSIIFGWLPTPIAIAFAGLVVLLVIFITVRIVKIILDTIPFL